MNWSDSIQWARCRGCSQWPAGDDRSGEDLDDEGQPVEIIEELDWSSPGATRSLPICRPGRWARHGPHPTYFVRAAGAHRSWPLCEPALPEETFTLLDLTCGACATTFRASATWAALTGVDSNWDGSDLAMQPRQLVATSSRQTTWVSSAMGSIWASWWQTRWTPTVCPSIWQCGFLGPRPMQPPVMTARRRSRYPTGSTFAIAPTPCGHVRCRRRSWSPPPGTTRRPLPTLRASRCRTSNSSR